MAINHNLFTGQTELAGEVRVSHAGEGAKQLPVHSGKKFIRLRPQSQKPKVQNKQTKEVWELQKVSLSLVFLRFDNSLIPVTKARHNKQTKEVWELLILWLASFKKHIGKPGCF